MNEVTQPPILVITPDQVEAGAAKRRAESDAAALNTIISSASKIEGGLQPRNFQPHVIGDGQDRRYEFSMAVTTQGLEGHSDVRPPGRDVLSISTTTNFANLMLIELVKNLRMNGDLDEGRLQGILTKPVEELR